MEEPGTMSMDDVQESQRHFAQSLLELHQTLGASFSALREAHSEVDPLWRDAMRHQYDAVWQDLDEEMDNYIHNSAPELLEIVAKHLGHTKRYSDD